jgi:hypothetical protein
MVEYSGLSDELPELPPKSCFKHFSLSQKLHLPENKPDIGRIVNAAVQINIICTKTINAPCIPYEEGLKSTVKNMIVQGELEQRLEYIGDTKDCEVHGACLNIPFISRIMLPEHYTLDTQVMVEGYIEDISLELLDKRNIFESITILLTAEY